MPEVLPCVICGKVDPGMGRVGRCEACTMEIDGNSQAFKAEWNNLMLLAEESMCGRCPQMPVHDDAEASVLCRKAHAHVKQSRSKSV